MAGCCGAVDMCCGFSSCNCHGSQVSAICLWLAAIVEALQADRAIPLQGACALHLCQRTERLHRQALLVGRQTGRACFELWQLDRLIRLHI